MRRILPGLLAAWAIAMPALAEACDGLKLAEKVTLQPFLLSADVKYRIASATCGDNQARFAFAGPSGQKTLTVELVGKDSDFSRPIRLDHVASGVLAGEQPAFEVEQVAVGVGRLGVHLEPTRRAPAHELLLGDVTEDQEPTLGEPHGALGEAHPFREAADLTTLQGRCPVGRS